MQVIVDTLNIHRAPHLDEIATLVALSIFGEAFFPGVRKALKEKKIDFNKYRTWTRQDYIKARKLPVGTGFGTWFNEHTREGERLKGWCAFTLCTRYLRIDRLPALRRLQKEVLRCDTRAECTPTMLAELIKVEMRRQEDYINLATKQTIKVGERTIVLDWAIPALEAIIHREMQIAEGKAMKPAPDEKTLMDYFLAWWHEEIEANQEPGTVIDPRLKPSLEQLMRQSMCKKDTTVTELAFVIEAMSRTGRKNEEIKDWLQFTFTAMYQGQVEFFAEFDRQEKVNSPIEFVRACLNGIDCFVMVSVVESDSKYAVKAARYRRNKLQKNVPYRQQMPGITLLRSSKGNTQVFADDTISKCWLQVKPVTGRPMMVPGIFSLFIRMVRTLELRLVRNGPIPKFEDLGMEGEGPDEIWYYYFEGGAMMNGSNTEERDPTRCPLLIILHALKHSLHPDLVREWVAENILST